MINHGPSVGLGRNAARIAFFLSAAWTPCRTCGREDHEPRKNEEPAYDE